MSSEDNKTLVRRFIEEVIGQGNLAILDELLASTYVYHAPGMEVSGPTGLKQVFTMLRTAFPDWYETTEDMIAEDDKVVFRVTGQGTHQGNFMGIAPTGRQVTMSGIDIVRIEGNKLVEHWAVFDQMGMMQQLGVIPATGQPAQ
jgi:predicted ester cyclase